MARCPSLLIAAAAAPLVAAGTAVAAFMVTGTHRTLNVSPAEARRRLPGDELLPHADMQNDRAITIAAPPAQVWPWIAQLGQDKAGFYSFACLENALGCQVRNADHIVPEWQHPHVGDPFPLHPDIVLRIALIEPGHAFVVSSAGGSAPKDMGFEFTWAFVLTYRPGEGDGGGATRLHVRERYDTHSSSVHALTEVTSVASAIMSWKMLDTLKRLAEAAPVTDPSQQPR